MKDQIIKILNEFADSIGHGEEVITESQFGELAKRLDNLFDCNLLDYFITQLLMEDKLLFTIKPYLKELSEKISEGDYTTDVTTILEEHKHSPNCFDKIPSLRDLQIPQEVFQELQLTVADCMHQVCTVSAGVVKRAKVIKFDAEELHMVITEGEYPGVLLEMIIYKPQEKYGLIGNILKKKQE